MKRVSIIVPALNEAAGIGETLAALAPLRSAGHELILADGGSSDGTIPVAAPLVDRVVEAPRGRASQMNAGASVARGEVLLFLHADTRLPMAAARLVLDGLARERRCWGRFDVRLSGRHPLLRLVERLMNLRSRITAVATGDQGIFVERLLFERLGGYLEIPLMEDVELSKRLRRHGPPLCLREPLITSSRRWESRGVVRTILLMWRLRLAYALGADPAVLADRYR